MRETQTNSLEGRIGAMGADADIRFLSRLPHFGNLSRDELRYIASRCRRRDLGAGEIAAVEGRPADGLYVICRGTVQIFTTSSGGMKQVLCVLGPGASFNDLPVFDGGPNPTSARAAVSGAGVCVIPASLVKELLATSPRVAANVGGMLAGWLRYLTAMAEDLSFPHSTEQPAKRPRATCFPSPRIP